MTDRRLGNTSLTTLSRVKSLQIEVDAETAVHVGVTGTGPDVVLLTGGPGCVQYLESDEIAPVGFRSWYPEPRGVGRSGGGPHTMEEAITDLEAIRSACEVERWIVVGHSWGSDLAVRYAVQHPRSVAGVVGIAGRGPQRDVTWSAAYERGRPFEPLVEIDWDSDVHASLGDSFTSWIHQPDLWRRLADCPVPMQFVAAGDDIRPSWPTQQLAALVRGGSFRTVPRVPHDFWSTDPRLWSNVVTEACTEFL